MGHRLLNLLGYTVGPLALEAFGIAGIRRIDYVRVRPVTDDRSTMVGYGSGVMLRVALERYDLVADLFDIRIVKEG